MTTQQQQQAAPPHASHLKVAGMQFVSGGCAGLVEVSIMHPLDLVKTRFQVQRGADDPSRYTSLADCVRKIVRSEGPLSFYKGILPPILAETPKRAVKFLTFEQYKRVFTLGELQSAGPVAFSLAGLGAGLTEAVVINPFEVVKVRLQTERAVTLGAQQSTWATARQIVRRHGLGSRGINKGLTSTLGRHGVFNCVYFGFYHSVKDVVPQCDEPRREFARKFLIGLCAGTLASCVNIPWDVAKSRIQGPQPGGEAGEVKYKGCWQTMRLVAREEGYLALYKGLLPKVMRLGPGGAIMLLVYEYMYAFLQGLC